MSGFLSRKYVVCADCGTHGPTAENYHRAPIAAYRAGWSVDGVLTFCPKCAGRMDAADKAMKELGHIRTMFRRAVVLARLGRKARETA